MTFEEVMKELFKAVDFEKALKENKLYPQDITIIMNNLLFIIKNYSIKNIKFAFEYSQSYWEYYLECYLHVEGSKPFWFVLNHSSNPEYIKEMIYDNLENKPKPKPKIINYKKYIRKIDIVEIKQDLALGLEQFYGCVNCNIHETAEEAVLKIRKALMKGLIKAELHVEKDYISREYDSWIGYIDNTGSKEFTYTSASELILAVMLGEIYL